MQRPPRAVLIANNLFPNEKRLNSLRCPENDVDGLKQALTSKTFGLFDQSSVVVLKNAANAQVQLTINRVLRQALKDQLVVLYYSGHGQLDDAGRLHLATCDTQLDALESTSVPFDQIKRYIEVGGSRQVAVILDCCYSGAVGITFMKGSAVGEELRRASEAQGVYVLTASTAVQVAQEKEGDRFSVLTKYIIDALTDGTADSNGDGYISLDELYTYVDIRVREESQQTPEKFALKVQGDLMIARTGRLLRDERNERMRAFLLDLASKGLISNAVLAQSLEVVALKASELSKTMKRYDELLDELQQKKLEVGQFLERWYRLESSPSIRPAESTIASVSAISRAQGESSQRAGLPMYALRRTLPKQSGGVTSGTFSPGGSSFASGAGDGQIRLWDANTGELRRESTPKVGVVWSLAFSPDGSRIASCGSAGLAVVTSLTGDRSQIIATSNAALLTLDYSSDGRLLAVGGVGGIVQVVDDDGKEVARFDTGQETVNKVIFDRRGRWLASCGNDCRIKIWELETYQLIRVLEGHRNAVYCAASSSNGEVLASGGRDGMVRLWDAAAWVPRGVLRGHRHSVLSLSFQSGAPLIASGGADGTIRFWDSNQFQLVRTVETGHIAVQFVCFSPNGQLLSSGGVDQTVRIWQPMQLRRNATA